jgi:cytochrome d ubiquinol oxidase subunit II
MVEAWFAIFWAMVAIYVILDGRTLGASALRLVVASNKDERQQVLEAIGPMWSWYEVWLVGVGGVLLLAFPSVLAAAFAGYYLALFLLLWLLILRGIAMEFGRHLDFPLWKSFWDFVLGASSALILLLLGVAFGNIIRGVPLDENNEFHMAFFTDFRVRGHVGLIDWYTLSTGVFSLLALLAHGAAFLASKSTGPVQERTRRAGKLLGIASLCLGVLVALETRAIRPDLWAALASRPLCLTFLVLAAAAGVTVILGYRSRRDTWAFAGSCVLIASVVGARAAATFPILLLSTLDPARSVSAYEAATRNHSLSVALTWFAVGAPLAGLWYFLATRIFRAKDASSIAY